MPPTQPIDADTPLAQALAGAARAPVIAALAAGGLATCEDLYECVANAGGNWYRGFPGLRAGDAALLVGWLAGHGGAIGEVTERFWPPGAGPAAVVG
ncbi:MAG: recombinase, partial [Duodenibacillus sp.]|nr:recombinase [Duodenibacillus sp.]